MNQSHDEAKEKRINPKYKALPGEFVYKNTCWVKWSSLDIIKRIENDFVFYPDDIVIATYPKSGTTLLQEIVWLMMNNVDLETSKTKKLIHRFPFLDEYFIHNYSDLNFEGYTIDAVELFPRPRFFKTHLLFRNLESQIEKNPDMKVLITFRNPKDNAVSMFHFYRGLSDYGPFEGTWDEFFERWIDGWIGGGDWLDVTTEWWNQRHRKNFKIVFYEDLLYRKREMVEEICEFLNKNLSDSQIDQIVQHTEFTKMKQNPAVNYLLFDNIKDLMTEDFEFMRKGEVGDWKNYFSEDQNRRLEEKYNPILEKIGLKFRYE